MGRIWREKNRLHRLITPLSNRQGFIIYLVAMVAFFAFLVISNFWILTHGEMQLLSRTEKLVLCEIAARSVYQEMVVELRTGPWENRSFNKNPVSKNGVTDKGITYQAVIENSPGHERQADIWVFTSVGQAARSVFFRINVQYSLYQKMNVIQCVQYTFLDPDTYDSPAKIPQAQQLVENILLLRQQKQAMKMNMVATVHNELNLPKILGKLELQTNNPLDVQLPFVPDAEAGYELTPVQIALLGVPVGEDIVSGSLTVKDFIVVNQTESEITPEMMAQLQNKLGKSGSAKVINIMKQFNTSSNMDVLDIMKFEENGYLPGIYGVDSRLVASLVKKVTAAQEKAIIDENASSGGSGGSAANMSGQPAAISGHNVSSWSFGNHKPVIDPSTGLAVSATNDPISEGAIENPNELEEVLANSVQNNGGIDLSNSTGASGTNIASTYSQPSSVTTVQANPETTTSSSGSSSRYSLFGKGGIFDRIGKSISQNSACREMERNIDRYGADDPRTVASKAKFEEKFSKYEEVSVKGITYNAAKSVKDKIFSVFKKKPETQTEVSIPERDQGFVDKTTNDGAKTKVLSKEADKMLNKQSESSNETDNEL